MDVKVNLMMPELLYKESLALVKKGMFSNYSELVRQAVRFEVSKYREREFTEKDKRLFELLKRMEKDGQLLTEEEMAERGIGV
jgi:Arc/MetJ-type ribon-helix-helix transcriptional regulator